MAISKEKKKSLDSVMAKINKRFGDGAVSTVTNIKEKLTIKRIKTPSRELNAMLYGGLAKGKIIEIFGPEGSGKTQLTIETIALEQKNDQDLVVGWVETEGSIDIEDLKMHGVDTDRLVYVSQEEVGNAENALDIVRALVASGEVKMIVCNSVAGLCPTVEATEDLGKQQMALVARLLSKFFRVITGSASKNECTIIFINQLRANVGNMYKPETTTGGVALQFYASQRIRLGKVTIKAEDPVDKETYMKVSCITHKNRFAEGHNPYTSCNYYVKYGVGIDSDACLPTFLSDAGIVRKAGAYWYYEDENGEPYVVNGMECKFKSKQHFVDALNENPVLKEELIAKLEGTYTPSTLSDEEIQEIQQENADNEKLMSTMEREVISEEIAEELAN